MNETLVRQALRDRYEAYAEGEWFTLAFFYPRGKEWLHFQVGKLDEAIEAIIAHPETDTYSTMGVFGREPRPGAKGTAKEITRCAWLWVDLDSHNGESPEPLLERLRTFTPRPT